MSLLLVARRGSARDTLQCRRAGASTPSKYALALRRISLAWRSSRFSRSRALSFAAISVVTPARPAVALGLAHPLMQRLRRAADLGRDRRDRRPTRGMLARDPKPSAPRGLAPRARTCSSSCLSWLHLLRSWSLRSTRRGSNRRRLHSALAISARNNSRIAAPAHGQISGLIAVRPKAPLQSAV